MKYDPKKALLYSNRSDKLRDVYCSLLYSSYLCGQVWFMNSNAEIGFAYVVLIRTMTILFSLTNKPMTVIAENRYSIIIVIGLTSSNNQPI